MGVLAKEAYALYLQSSHWKELRKFVMDQLDSRCTVCFRQNDSNEVHHIYYCGDWYKTQPHHLTVLCDEHHELMHKHLKSFPKPENPSGHFKLFKKLREHLRSMCPGALVFAACHPGIKYRVERTPQPEKTIARIQAKKDWKSRRMERFNKWQRLTDEELDQIESVINKVRSRKIKI